MEHDAQNEISLTKIAATIAEIMEVEAPQQADRSIGWLADIMKQMLDGKADKALIFSADAVPLWLVRKNTELFAAVYKNAPVSIPVRSVMPTVTPVAYAAMFSGALSQVNGVDQIVPPVLSPELTQPLIRCDTLMAALVRAGLKIAVITCANGCIASMLSRSGADFYIIDGDDDEAMFQKAMEVVQNDQYDFVFLYQLGFDYAMHKTGPESKEVVETLKTMIERFNRLCEAVRTCWKGNSLVVFNSDHGCHLEQDGRGHHGLDISEDTDIMHFWGAIKHGESNH